MPEFAGLGDADSMVDEVDEKGAGVTRVDDLLREEAFGRAER